MGTINKKSTQSVKLSKEIKKHEENREEKAHLNWMGDPSYKIGDPIFNLKLAASSCFFGEPQYYHSGEADKTNARATVKGSLSNYDLASLRKTLNAIDPQEWRGMSSKQMMESAIDKALAHDPESTLLVAAELRNSDNIRTTPQVIMVRAAHCDKLKGTGLIRKYAKMIMKRADEPAVQLAYQIETYGRSKIPNSLKKAWKDVLEGFNDYQLAKYRMESREVKTVDVMNLVHPKSESISKLAKGELKTTGETWESIISAEGSNEKSWTKALDHLGHMALLKNLRNLIQNNIAPREFVNKLVDGVESGKQLPFRYFSALKAVDEASSRSGAVLDALEECLEKSIDNLPKFEGRVMSLCDNSGSAWSATTSSMGTMHIAEIANLTALLTAKASEDGWVGRFGDKLVVEQVRKKESIYSQLKKMCAKGYNDVGGNTEHGIWTFWETAIKEKQHWDHVFTYSDMQAGRGQLYGTSSVDVNFVVNGRRMQQGMSYVDVPKLIMEYRNKVNPNVKVFLVQVAGYQDTIIPEFYDKTYMLSGWSDNVLKFASKVNQFIK